MRQIAAQRMGTGAYSLLKDVSMHRFKASELETATANTSHSHCECGQVAYRIVRVNVDQNPTDVPLCGRHYMEALQTIKQDPDSDAPTLSISQ